MAGAAGGTADAAVVTTALRKSSREQLREQRAARVRTACCSHRAGACKLRAARYALRTEACARRASRVLRSSREERRRMVGGGR